MDSYRVRMTVLHRGDKFQMALTVKATGEYDASFVAFVNLLDHLDLPLYKEGSRFVYPELKCHISSVELITEEKEDSENAEVSGCNVG